jgi:hypothetical protein
MPLQSIVLNLRIEKNLHKQFYTIYLTTIKIKVI